jgi:hypothetical protein
VPEVRLVAEAPDAGAGARTEGDAAVVGGAHETGEDGRGLGEWVRTVFAYIILGVKPVSTPHGVVFPQGIAIVDAPPGI